MGNSKLYLYIFTHSLHLYIFTHNTHYIYIFPQIHPPVHPYKFILPVHEGIAGKANQELEPGSKPRMGHDVCLFISPPDVVVNFPATNIVFVSCSCCCCCWWWYGEKKEWLDKLIEIRHFSLQ